VGIFPCLISRRLRRNRVEAVHKFSIENIVEGDSSAVRKSKVFKSKLHNLVGDATETLSKTNSNQFMFLQTDVAYMYTIHNSSIPWKLARMNLNSSTETVPSLL